ncbi:MAG: carbohydrate kinase family protein [Lachnospiraceae bacterium]
MHNTVVIGTTFVDLKGFSIHKYDPQGRNLGEVKIVHGGVGRNVVENFANVGMPVSYVGMLEDSAIGRDVARHLAEIGADLDHVVNVPENGIGMWLVILDEKGDLAGSISKMPDITYLEKYLKENGDGIISGAESVVLELDLSETIAEMIVNLAKKHHKKIYSIVGNMSVILARKDLVRQTDCFICNEIEAGKFFDDPALTAFNPAQMLDYLPGAAKEAGIRSMVVTMGAQGSVYYDEDTQVSGICQPIPVQVVDTSGAGDAFFSGTVMALTRAIPLPEAVVYGARLASATISRAENNCPADKEFFT